jgi:CcmD family protein
MEESNLKFIIAAYSVSWLVILGYLARLMRKGSQARADYDHMSQEIPAGGPR